MYQEWAGRCDVIWITELETPSRMIIFISGAKDKLREVREVGEVEKSNIQGKEQTKVHEPNVREIKVRK